MPSLLSRAVSSVVSSYPLRRGQTRLRTLASPWLVAQLPHGPWARVSGVVDAEWTFLKGRTSDAATEVVQSILRPGAVFVDVGANVGYFTLIACAIGAKVTAFEPTPKVFQRLQENLDLNGFSATLFNTAVMDQPGTLPFYISPDDPEANNLFGEGDNVFQVPAVRLDDKITGPVDLLKIDAEGAEPFVLDGARQLLSTAHPKVLIEVNPHTLQASGFTPQDVLGRLASHGYQTKVIDSTPYKGHLVSNVLAY